jgi:tRNA nucleotidyltransferase (CCA-adding enzyme)
MSWGVQTLDPDLTVADAASRMERFGFEGYPVADLGKVVGMLTRREVDRALRHGMQQAPVAQIMSRGSYSVTPADGLDILQRRMMETGWGQMPVVDRESGQMVGIVTRTDLIKLWGGEPRRVSEADEMNSRMQTLLPPPLVTLLFKAGEAASQLNFPLYAVGGFVRDLLLDQPNFDIDLVVEGDAIALARLLAQTFGGHVRSHRRFGTAKWILRADGVTASSTHAGKQTRADEAEGDEEPGEDEVVEYRGTGDGLDLAVHELPVHSLDFVTARTEFYEHPTALPTVERSSIKLDLHRRDFTINTLAIRLNPERRGELLDFYNGKEDLENGVVRVLHSLSFVEDPTRILRAVRFEQRFHFQIEPRTEQLIVDALDLLGRVSPARVRHELELILGEQEPEHALARLQQMRVLEHIDRHLTCDRWIAERFPDLRSALHERKPPDELPRLYLALWLYRLDRIADLSVTDRLRLRADTQRVLAEVRALQRQLIDLGRPALRPSEIDTILQPSSPAARLVVRVAGESWLVQQRIDYYERNLMHVKITLDGHRLRALGVPPGPVYRQILTAVRAARLDGTVQTVEEEVALAQALAAEGAD